MGLVDSSTSYFHIQIFVVGFHLFEFLIPFSLFEGGKRAGEGINTKKEVLWKDSGITKQVSENSGCGILSAE